MAAMLLAKDLPFCLFVQTFVFVLFNKVITAQVKPIRVCIMLTHVLVRSVLHLVYYLPAVALALHSNQVQVAWACYDRWLLCCRGVPSATQI